MRDFRDAVAGLWLVGLGGVWVWIFTGLLPEGKVVLTEPSFAIRVAEAGLMIVLIGLGLWTAIDHLRRIK